MSNKHQRFLEGSLATGIEAGFVRPEDIFEHIRPETLAKLLPVKLKAKLLGACLNSSRVTPSFLLDVVGLEALSQYAPSQLLWRCIEASMQRALGSEVTPASSEIPAKKSKKKAAKGANDDGADADTLSGQQHIDDVLAHDMRQTSMGIGPPSKRVHGTDSGMPAEGLDFDDSVEIITAVGAALDDKSKPQNKRER
jgi:hypothetical protein